MAFPWSVLRIWYSISNSAPHNLNALPFLFRLFFHNSISKTMATNGGKQRHARVYSKGTEQAFTSGAYSANNE